MDTRPAPAKALPEDAPSGLLLLVSEQLWPHLATLFHFVQCTPNLAVIRVLHTEDADRSARPAMRLREFAQRKWPHLDARCEMAGTSPESVRETARKVVREMPRIGAWFFNVTGGTKTMFGGALDVIGTRGLRVLYKELGRESWVELTRNQEGLSSTPFAIASEITDEATVLDLVRVQYGEEGEQRWSGSPGESIEVLEILRAAAESGWNWKRAFGPKAPPGETSGMCFERFLCGVIRDFGVHHVVHSLKLREGSKMLQEIDLVVNHRGQLTIFDCKLTSVSERSTPAITQIDQAAALRRKLGGLQARYVMVRPNWPQSESQSRLARAVQVQLWSQTECSNLIDRLADLFGMAVPPALQPVWDFFSEVRSLGMDVLAQSSALNRAPEAYLTFENPAFHNLDALVGTEINQHNKPWVMLCLEGILTLVHARPQNVSDAQWTPARVESWLRHFIPWAEIIPGSTSIGSKSLLRCRLRPIPTSELPVGAQTQREWTQSWANRSLFDGEFHSFPEGTPAPTQCAKTASPGHVPAGIRTVEITKPVPPVPRNVPVECAYIGSVGVNAEFNVQLPGGGSMVGFLEASRFTKEEIESGKTLVLYVSGVSGNRLQLARNDRPASWRQKRKG